MRNSVLALLLASVLAACGGELDGEAAATSSSATPETTHVPASTRPEGSTETTTEAQVAGTSETTDVEDPAPSAGGCADVVGVDISGIGEGIYRFDVTVSSPDTGWEKYADAWEVRAPDGSVIGTRELTHPHVDEQPFTRSLSGVEIPDDIRLVTVAARDSIEGFCGAEMTVEVG